MLIRRQHSQDREAYKQIRMRRPGNLRTRSSATDGAHQCSTRREARLRRRATTTLSPAEIAVGVIIGRTSEFFDFFVYAIASVLVFPR